MTRDERYTQVLALLDRQPPLTRREIASILGVSHQYVTDLINDLDAAGMIFREIGKPRTTRLARTNTKARSTTA